MQDVVEYREAMLAGLRPRPAARLRLADAAGLVLAEDVRAEHDFPAADIASIDGYAVVSADGIDAVAFPVMSGDPLPAGCDAVVPAVDVRLDGDRVTLLRSVGAGEHVRRQGSDLARGALAVAHGTVIDSRSIGMLAACNMRVLLAHPRVRVAIVSVGDELSRPSRRESDDAIIDSNGPMLMAAVTEIGGTATRHGPVPDDTEELQRALRNAAAQSDIIITTGGLSHDGRNTVRTLLTELGGVNFVDVAMHPGSLHGHGVFAGTPIITLPGNPVSACVSFHVLAAPAIRRLQGRTQLLPHLQPAVLQVPLSPAPGTRQFVRAMLRRREQLEVVPLSGHGRHALAGLVHADCLIVIPPRDTDLPVGSIVQVFELRGI